MSGRYLLDASALINIRDRINVRAFEEKRGPDLYIIDLTPFEYGNAMWKLFVRGRIGKSAALASVRLLEGLLDLGIIKLLAFREYVDAIRISTAAKVSYYDAAYIVVAKKHALTLVTDDNGLLANSRVVGVDSIASEELVRRHPGLFYS